MGSGLVLYVVSMFLSKCLVFVSGFAVSVWFFEVLFFENFQMKKSEMSKFWIEILRSWMMMDDEMMDDG